MSARYTPPPSSGGGGLALADGAGATTSTEPNSIKGSGTYNVVTLPAETPVLAVKLAGDAHPRVVLSADPDDFGVLFIGNGTYDPVSSGAQMYLGSMSGQPAFVVNRLTAQGPLAASSGATFGDDATFGIAKGPVLRAPDASLHRLTVADDGTVSSVPLP